ncbi:L-threonylcarbamoyladenylate synthase [Fusobacterium sp.]|uniref:L-threonylcarbamoyladenylate synthase n=1 Tax=Fusobacterium sp. TaxID=68766 RepID=UPI0015A60D80|nr:L-threonylcarbamoyladenylate synthase [Fusobacterium sp.]MDY2980973.1 L-threonylcarbamoyladenylate synthase [Fusobacterium sp.]
MEMSLEKIGTRLKKGELIIYPTDTVYGVGGVLKEDTLKKIYEAKTRSFSSPLIALVNSLDKVDEIAIISDEHREKINKLIERFWPGGLTIILKKRENVPAIMVSNGETVGVRMPNHKLALDIIESAGGILATTSANISGEATPSSFVEISPIFKERVDIVIDGGKCPIGTASTIIDMSKSKISILREGSISKEEIENIIGKI